MGEDVNLKWWEVEEREAFSLFHSGWVPALVSGCMVTFDPVADGLQRQL